MKIRAKNAFTLVELLVVISIISLLSSVVLASLAGARDKAKTSASQQFNTNIYHGIGDSLVAWWNMEDGWNGTSCSGTTVKDDSTIANNGTAAVNTWSTDVYSGYNGRCSLSFNGSSQKVTIPYDSRSRPTAQMTVSAWVKPATGSLNALREIYRSDGSDGTILVSFQGSGNCSGGGGTGGCITFGINTGGSYSELDVNISSQDWENKWSLVTVSYDGSKKKIYKDGKEIGSVSASGSVGQAQGAVAYIGCYSGSLEFFSGLIDDVRVYSNGITAYDAQKLYAEGLAGHQNIAER